MSASFNELYNNAEFLYRTGKFKEAEIELGKLEKITSLEIEDLIVSREYYLVVFEVSADIG